MRRTNISANHSIHKMSATSLLFNHNIRKDWVFIKIFEFLTLSERGSITSRISLFWRMFSETIPMRNANQKPDIQKPDIKINCSVIHQYSDGGVRFCSAHTPEQLQSHQQDGQNAINFLLSTVGRQCCSNLAVSNPNQFSIFSLSHFRHLQSLHINRFFDNQIFIPQVFMHLSTTLTMFQLTVTYGNHFNSEMTECIKTLKNLKVLDISGSVDHSREDANNIQVVCLSVLNSNLSNLALTNWNNTDDEEFFHASTELGEALKSIALTMSSLDISLSCGLIGGLSCSIFDSSCTFPNLISLTLNDELEQGHIEKLCNCLPHLQSLDLTESDVLVRNVPLFERICATLTNLEEFRCQIPNTRKFTLEDCVNLLSKLKNLKKLDILFMAHLLQGRIVEESAIRDMWTTLLFERCPSIEEFTTQTLRQGRRFFQTFFKDTKRNAEHKPQVIEDFERLLALSNYNDLNDDDSSEHDNTEESSDMEELDVR